MRRTPGAHMKSIANESTVEDLEQVVKMYLKKLAGGSKLSASGD